MITIKDADTQIVSNEPWMVAEQNLPCEIVRELGDNEILLEIVDCKITDNKPVDGLDLSSVFRAETIFEFISREKSLQVKFEPHLRLDLDGQLVLASRRTSCDMNRMKDLRIACREFGVTTREGFAAVSYYLKVWLAYKWMAYLSMRESGVKDEWELDLPKPPFVVPIILRRSSGRSDARSSNKETSMVPEHATASRPML